METMYTGFYCRFDTKSKKDAAVLLGADNLIGDSFDIVFITEGGLTSAWLKNRFDRVVGYFDQETTRKLRILDARECVLKALLSFVAYTDSPEPGCYWGEVAIVCFDQHHQLEFEIFIKNVSKRLMEGIRPEIDLGDQGAQRIIESVGAWSPSKTVPFPKNEPGTAIMKSRRKMSEKFIESGRQGNKGCYLISWIFLLLCLIFIVFGLKSCGVF